MLFDCLSEVQDLYYIFFIRSFFFFKDFSIDPEDKYLLKDLNIETIFSLVTEYGIMNRPFERITQRTEL